jgi:HD-GYP domain-containing protein (c-di-GMP phosphodiesterase class II)
MAIFTLPDFEMDMLNELMDEINQLYEASETTLISLERTPDDIELQRALFRAVHTIKGDLGLVMFSPIIPLISHVEDLLDHLRKGKVSYTSIMSDLVLLSMDKVKLFTETAINHGEAQYDNLLYKQLGEQINKINQDNAWEHESLLARAVLLLDPTLNVNIDAEQSPELFEESNSFDSELKDDLTFFRDVMQPIEKRSHYWAGKGDRIAKMSLYINEVAGNPIPKEQLIAACYVHDFGMAFVNHNLLHKVDDITEQEKMVIKDHVYGSTMLLKNLTHWQHALKIVMQHHERCDGSGYPLGLKSNEICDGAKLLAIVDSFEALTHERAQSNHIKRPIRRAVIQLNAEAEGLFCPQWITHFNTAMMKLISKC